MFLRSILTLFFIASATLIMACHETTIQENSVTDNGDGTYTYEVQICMGSEDTYGFELTFNGANIVSADTPCITSTTTGATICATIPSTSGGGDVEYGDFDDNTSPAFNELGDGQLCVTLTFTLDNPAADVELNGTEESIGFCGGTGDLTSCFGLMNVSGSATDASTGCTSDGSISANGSNGFNPYTYSWDNGDTGSSISGLAPGDYVVTVTDAEGCVETDTYTVGPSPDYTIVLTSSCGGSNDATWEIDDTNGDPIGSGTQTNGTNEYTACGCGANATLTYGTTGGQACSGVSLEVFDASGSSLGTATGNGETFALDCVALPIVLKSFEVKYNKEKKCNEIRWSTHSERNNDYFILEYSEDGINWTDLEEIDGAGNSLTQNDYYFVHRDIAVTTNYYRLKQIDFDGDENAHGIRSIDNLNHKTLIRKVNLLGQEVGENFEGIVILQYDNGTSEKVYQ